MYSVEDLLISHGYKLPKSGPASAPPYDKRPSDCQREPGESSAPLRPGRGALNGYEGERAASSLTGLYGARQALVKAYPGAESEGPDRILRRKDMAVGVLQDGQVVDSLAVDSGFYDVPSLTYSDPLSLVSLGHDDRDLSYWRRRGQDFSLLLDYADGRELRASTTAWRPQALLTAEELRAERQAQQLWEDLSWLRDPDSGPGQLRVTEEERKCQSLGNEEWRPAALGRSDSDDRWALDPYRLRTPDGFFHAKTKAKSQSLPRVLSPEGNTCRELVPSRPSLPDRQRMSSTVFSGPYSRYVYGAGRERWGRSSGPASHVALLPKPRFSRPLKPPSYEIHQQTRGSAEMLTLEQGAKQKDRLAYYSRSGDFRQEYYAQQAAITGMEPPGYIPPPSYKRPLPPRAVSMNRHEMANLRWRADTLQMPNSDPGRWLTRQTRSWVGYYADRASSYRRQISVPPGNEEHMIHQPDQQRQFLPITSGEDPKPKPISGGQSGSMLTDSEKAVRSATTIKDIPSAKSLGQSTLDSAFPPQQVPAIMPVESRKTATTETESCIASRSFVRGMRKSESVGPEQTRSQFFPSSILGKPPPPPVKPPPEQAVAETMTETKKVEVPEPLPPEKPEKEKEKTKNLKKRLSETIFCLVSVPVTPQPTMTIRDQNNNNEKSPDPADSPTNNKTGHLTNQSLQSTSSAEAELQALTASFASSKTSSRSSSKMFKKVSCRPPKINHYKELKLTGAWPANQYRDQETQTTPEVEIPENKEAQVDGSGNVIDHNAVGTAFTFPMKGVKSLKLSSNSAFSITATFSNQISQGTASGNVDEPEAEEEDSEKEGFDPYIIKPASQRAWDAVKELEAIKKEVQEQEQQQQHKQPSVDKCIEDLNEAYKDILELGTAGNKVPNGSVQIPERIKIRLTSEPLNKPSSLRRSAVSWSVDPEYREVKSAFSRPATKSVTFSKQLREELPVPPRETGFREYRVVAHLSRRRSNDGRTVKLDLSDEPIETPLCDFSPTTLNTAAEVPWADRQPMQDASTLTSPPDYEDICQTLRQTRDPADASRGGSRPNEEMMQDMGADSEEECPICKREMENQMRQGPLPPLHEENSSDSSANQNASPPQRAALESPPEDVKAKGDSDLDKKGSGEEVKEESLSSADDTNDRKDTEQAGNSNEIGVNTDVESQTEEIKDSETTLASDVPTDSQVSEGQKDGSKEDAKEQAVEIEAKAGVSDVSESVESKERLVKLNDECKNEPTKVEEQEKKPLVSPEHRLSLWTQLGRDPAGLPEFPPDRLPLSVPPTLDRRLSLSLEGERKSRGLSHRIEALQNKLAISPGRVAVERISRMREVDVICRVRRLSIRSTDSGEGDTEAESKKEELLEPPEQKEKDNTDTGKEEEEVVQSQKDPEETGTRDKEEPSSSEPIDPSPVEPE
ncbi:junctional cadherin 5-associated protein [Boleophthalmus pectinirostris]|uniref:junctional cadherin 5-associated protein n=1 Tax=Boleophthalmus pectinirostris TaxID=150288 RepID=UPI00242D795A|nr:junctional cadherin 5-associated protein [Boleophthalmus pectinirostris]